MLTIPLLRVELAAVPWFQPAASALAANVATLRSSFAA